MRIAVDARVLELPCPTGVERAAAELLRALPHVLPDGAEAVVVSRGPLPMSPFGGRVRQVEIGGPDAALLWRESHLAPALVKLGADVLWSPVTAIPLRSSIPRVATFHEAPWLVRPGIEGRMRETAHALRLRVAVATAARIVCPSRASADQIAAIHPDAAQYVRVVPHGVPARFFVPGDAAAAAARRARLGVDGPYLLQVGGTRGRKNVPFLLRAFARYRLRGGASSLVVAGPGEPPPRVPRGARFTGWVEDDDLVALYDGAAALVVASEAEGFGIPVLEAMARGTPVLVVPVGGLVEAAGGAALVSPAGDDDAFAAAMQRIELDAELRRDLAANGRVRVGAARWEDSARKLVGVLEEAIVGPLAVEEGSAESGGPA